MNCTVTWGPFAEKENYTVTCNDTAITLKIKEVQKSQHLDVWTCRILKSAGEVFSSKIYVKDPPSSPPAIGVYTHTFTYRIREFITGRLSCTVQESNPPSTVEWKCTSAAYSQNTMDDSQKELIFKVSRGTNASCICFYIYRKSLNVSTMVKFDVLYPPDIELKNNSAVIENDSFTTTCIASGGLTTNQSVIWSTRNNTYGYDNSTLSIPNVKREMEGTCRCLLKYTLHPTYGESISNFLWKELFVSVLYPPEKFVTTLTLNGTVHQNISSSFSVVENAQMTMVCAALGNPIPTKYTWTGARHSDNETLQLVAYSSLVGNLTCSAETAENTLTPTDKESRKGIGEQTYKIIVLYRPSIRDLLNYSVLEGSDLNTTCKLEPGMTTNQSVKWLKDSKNVSASSDLQLQNIARTMSQTYICQLDLTMVPTYGSAISEVHTRSFFLDVLFPPENIQVQMSLGQRKYNNILDRFSVVENKTSDMTLDCFAFANPLPTNFLWEGDVNSDSAILQLMLTRNITGKYTCSVNNTMLITYVSTESKVGMASKVYDINVLYPPSIQPHPDHTVLEGTDYETTCITNEGRTTMQSLKWLSEFTKDDDFSILSILNIQRNHSGIFTCQQNFTLNPTYGNTVDDSHSTDFFLDVLYPPESVTVSMSTGSEFYYDIKKNISLIENVTVILNCYADGNPKPLTIWSGPSGSASEMLELSVHRNVTGSYRCIAKNTMNLSFKGETKIGEEGKNYSIYVLYPPSFEENDQYDIIEWQDVSINCYKPGKTSSQWIRWIESQRISEPGVNNTLSLHNVTRNTSESFTCELNYTMMPTYGDSIQRMHSKTFKLNVLYPPENIRMDVRGIQSLEVTIPDILAVIENYTRELDFSCTASANPTPRNVFWTGPQGRQTSHLFLQAHRNSRGTYTCHAENEMIPTKGYPQTGYRNRSYNIDFLCMLTTALYATLLFQY